MVANMRALEHAHGRYSCGEDDMQGASLRQLSDEHVLVSTLADSAM
jgi:hypothetical protein